MCPGPLPSVQWCQDADVGWPGPGMRDALYCRGQHRGQYCQDAHRLRLEGGEETPRVWGELSGPGQEARGLPHSSICYVNTDKRRISFFLTCKIPKVTIRSLSSEISRCPLTQRLLHTCFHSLPACPFLGSVLEVLPPPSLTPTTTPHPANTHP